jgi:hypothetical protein
LHKILDGFLNYLAHNKIWTEKRIESGKRWKYLYRKKLMAKIGI